MKFAFDSAESRGRAIMNSLRSQPVFSSGGSVIPYTEEWIFVISNLREWEGPTIRTLYLRAVSDEKTRNGPSDLAWGLLGQVTREYKLDYSKLDGLITETGTRIDKDLEYARLTWHDCVVLLTTTAAYRDGQPMHDWAGSHLHYIMKRSPDVKPLLIRLLEKPWNG